MLHLSHVKGSPQQYPLGSWPGKDMSGEKSTGKDTHCARSQRLCSDSSSSTHRCWLTLGQPGAPRMRCLFCEAFLDGPGTCGCFPLPSPNHKPGVALWILVTGLQKDHGLFTLAFHFFMSVLETCISFIDPPSTKLDTLSTGAIAFPSGLSCSQDSI